MQLEITNSFTEHLLDFESSFVVYYCVYLFDHTFACERRLIQTQLQFALFYFWYSCFIFIFIFQCTVNKAEAVYYHCTIRNSQIKFG